MVLLHRIKKQKSICKKFKMTINGIKYNIGETYKYANYHETFILKNVSTTGNAYFECGHWCTDNVFVDLINVNQNRRVGRAPKQLKLKI